MTFDQSISRLGTSSLKWDWYKNKDIIPMWVADMDFPSSPAIIDAIKKRADHGIFGYTLPPDALYNAITDTMSRHYGWTIKRDWIVFVPGVVSALNITCKLSPKPDILVPSPVYPPFFEAPVNTGHQCISVDLVEENGRLVFDFERFEAAITDKTGMLLLCSPHNPGGTVFTKNELTTLARICQENNILICSDEIHCGLVLDSDTSHIPTAALSEEISMNTITLMAPSKTYNIPGLGCSFAIIENEALRNQFISVSRGIVPHVNLMGLTATLAAYADSRQWHSDLLTCLRENRRIVFDAVNAMPGLRMLWPESTYLAWIDTREAGINTPGIFFESHGVGLSDGKYFGKKGFVRLNFGCSKAILKEGLKRMADALKTR